MSGKTQFLGPVLSGLDTGARETGTVGAMRFCVLTTVGSVPVTGLLIASLPPDAMLNEINVTLRTAIVGEAVTRFGTTNDGSDNVGQVTVSGATKFVAFQNYATAQTTFPFGRTPISAGSTPLYFSTGTTSGSLVSLGTGGMIEVIYTRLPFGESVSASAGFKVNATRFQGPIRTGVDSGQGLAQQFAHGIFSQITTASTAPVTGQIVAVLPIGAAITELNLQVKTAAAGEGVARFTINSAAGGDTLGSVSISGARVYSVALATAFTTLPYGVNNTGSALPVYLSLVPVSGSIAAIAAVSEVVYSRFGQDSGYPGVGQKSTNFKRIATGRDVGLGDSLPSTAYGRFMQLTTVVPLGSGVTSSQQVGILPPGAHLLEAYVLLRASLPGEARVRFAAAADFASNNLGQTTASAAGRYSIMQSTTNFTIPGGVNNTGTGIPLYVSTLALSGSVTLLTANAVIEIVFARLDPVRFNGG